MPKIRTRFAPSPTGHLHLGHALAAKIAHDLARSSPSGKFLLRHEDIDATRVRPEYLTDIEEDLRWLGLTWDDPPLIQSTRLAAYESALETLRQRGLIYPCFCTRRAIRDEIASMAGAPQGPEGPLYPGTCRDLTPQERARRIAAGEQHAWRLNALKSAETTGALDFSDHLHGTITVDPQLLGDVILSRKDIGPAYHLAVVVDDAFQNITHVTRGVDLLPSTHVHRQLQALLALPAPIYLHHPLALDDDGKRLAKRHDALALSTMRKSGLTPQQILALCDAIHRA